jgi:hypothetical protein
MWGKDVAQLMVVTSTLGFSFPWLTLSGNKADSWQQISVTVSMGNNTDRVLNSSAFIFADSQVLNCY